MGGRATAAVWAACLAAGTAHADPVSAPSQVVAHPGAAANATPDCAVATSFDDAYDAVKAASEQTGAGTLARGPLQTYRGLALDTFDRDELDEDAYVVAGRLLELCNGRRGPVLELLACVDHAVLEDAAIAYKAAVDR